MAIRIEFYELIVPVQTGKLYYPQNMDCFWCWNDGVICTPGGAMNPSDVCSIIAHCEDMGLAGLKEIDGEKKLLDYCIVSQFCSSLNAKCDWLRVRKGVAWNPEYPFGLNQPDKFPCSYGGFYFESKDVWEQSKVALLTLDEAIQEYERKEEQKNMVQEETKMDSNNLIIWDFDAMPRSTPYDNFFIKLGQKTLEQGFRSLFAETP